MCASFCLVQYTIPAVQGILPQSKAHTSSYCCLCANHKTKETSLMSSLEGQYLSSPTITLSKRVAAGYSYRIFARHRLVKTNSIFSLPDSAIQLPTRAEYRVPVLQAHR